MDASNSITPNIPVEALDGAAAASLVAAATSLYAQFALQAAALVPGQDGQLVLPSGVGIDDIRVVGRDLIVRMPDGSEVLIPDGAVFVPQFVVDGVAIPPANLAALLVGQEPKPEAGPPQSSGGNFAQTPGDIGDPFGLGDLLPPTQLAFPQPEEREQLPDLVDEEPTTIIITPDQPAGSVSATASVNEAGLPARGSEPPGSDAASNSETTTGSIVFAAPDGLASITLNGVAITAVGQTFVTSRGVLTITSIAPGNYGYSYTLNDNTSGDNTSDDFAVVVTDSDGDTSSATLAIRIVDDTPTARNDTDSVPAANFGAQTGNVMTGVGTTSGSAGADTQGADAATVTGFRAGTSGTFGGAGSTINGQYGVLTLNANGGYTYTRNAGTPGGVNDVFSYQLTDGDGDTSTATLTISIGDSPATVTSVPTTAGATIVDEEGLPARGGESPGSNPTAPVETASGTITFVAPDGVASVQINGVTITGPGQVITLPTGTFLVTGYDPAAGTLGYTFTLTDNTVGDSTTQVITVTVTDTDGDGDTEPFTITIIDDTPTARDDSGTQTAENAPVTVNVIGNDTPGADGVSLTGGVAMVAGSLSGTGSVVYNNDGTFTYTPGAGEEGIVTFQYRITDGDGDSSTATVTITLLSDSTPRIAIEGDRDVNEAGLPARGSEPAGSDAASNSEIATGTLNMTTGNDGIGSLVINGINVTNGGTVAGASGTLVVTRSGSTYSYSYTLTDNTSGDATTDSFAVTLTDSDGDAANDTLVIAIIDDRPTAVADTDSIASGQYGPATGNVITDASAGDTGDSDAGADTQGADAVVVSSVSGTAAGIVGGSTSGQYGVLTLNGDGSYSYVRNAGTPGGVSDVFTYTIRDGDGDTSISTLTISIADSPTTLNLPTSGQAGTQVDEAGLPTGSNAAATSETTAGTIAYTAPDGPAIVTIDGETVTSVGQTFTGSFGTLIITSIAGGSIGYSYTLATNTSGDETFDDFAVVVTDQDGDSTPGTLVIDIVDDVPTARPDIDSVTEDEFVDEEGNPQADGNVLTGVGGLDANSTDGVADTPGADGVSVTAVRFGATAGSVGSGLNGAYGELVLNGDGSYSYVLNNFDPRVQGLDSNDTLTEIFHYTITDGDGDIRETTLTITINGSDDPIVIGGLNVEGPELVVDEDDLSDGSSPNAAALTQSGTFSVDGTDGITSVRIEGIEAFVGQTFTNAYGIFTITSISAPANGTTTSITIGYSYTLTDNTAHPNAGGQNFLTEIFDIDVTDTDGSTDSATIEVRIIDDVPTAVNDSDTIAGGSSAPATGNVITDTSPGDVGDSDTGADTRGADGANVTAISGFGGAGAVGGVTNGQYGVLTLNGDGGYSYVRNSGSPGNVSDVFTYTITDSDGDISTATLTINILDDAPVVGPNATVLLDDDSLSGIAGGTGDDDDAVNVAGTLSGSGGDGALTWALQTSGAPGGFTYIASGTGINVFQGATQVLSITLNSATGAYVVTQIAPIVHVAGNDENNESFTINYTVSDIDSDSAPGTLTINVDDDTPTATSSTTQPVLAVDETVLATNASASFAGVFTTAFGADGPAAANSLTYALQITAGPSGLVDIATGEAVNLVLNGAVVEGRTATTNQLVFTVSVNAGGTVTLDQIRAVTHNDPLDADEPGASAATLAADNLIRLVATVTDRDGDIASATANIGQNLQFEDDGPSVTASTTQPTLAVDETVLATNASASFAGIFTPAFGADGAAAANSITYALGAVAGPSGLIDVATGEAVNLVLNGAVVEGRSATTNQLVFTISVDAAGNVTLDQIRAVVHNDPTDPDEPGASAATLSGDNLVTLTATVTDRDGDTDTATANIGQNLQFEDDGPSVTASTTQPVLAVDESVLVTNASASFAGVFAPVFGADGAAAANSVSYALQITAGPSGLIDVATGEAVNLVLNGTVVEGRSAATNQLVFTVSVDAAGSVTLDQIRAVTHNDPTDPDEPGASAATLAADNLIRLVATVTDRDGDTANATANIGQNLQFEDDGPSVTAATTQPTLAVDETVLTTNATASFAGVFAPVFGADGAAAANSVTYALGINAGATNVFDVATGLEVVLTVEAGQVVGRAGAGGAIVFTVSIAANGEVTLDQQRAVVHNDPADPDEPGASAAMLGTDNLITITATVTDRDGDTATATANIGQNLQFEDDGPSVTASTTQPVLAVDETILATNASASFAGVFTPVFGADGAAAANSITYALEMTAGASGLIDVATGEAVNLVLNGSVVEGRSATTNQLVFTVSVNAGGTVTLDQIRAVTHNDPLDADEPGASAATLAADNLIRLVATVTDRDGDTTTATANIGQNLQFEDDGPTVTATGPAPTLTVDETVLTTDAGPTSFAGIFSVAYGADGAGSTAYALSVNTGIASGLVDTATGQAVVLSVAGNVVTGRAGAGGPVVFTLTVNTTTGELTLDQQRAVAHNVDGGPVAAHDDPISLAAGAISLSATATDRDGDTSSATVQIGTNLVFEDDGPTLAAGAAVDGDLTVDETVLATNDTANFASLFTPTYGADGAGSVGNFQLGVSANGVASGVFDTATGNQVFLFLEAGVVVGRAGANAGAAVGGPIVFTVGVNAAGVATLDQVRAVLHSPDTGPNQPISLTSAGLITLTATVTDGDGDTHTATASIGNSITFLDDTGILGAFNGVTVVNAANVIGNGTFAYTQGADGHGSFAITGPALPGITYATVQNANGALLTATTDPDGAGGNPPITVFTLQVNSNGTYAFTLVTPQAAATETVSLLGLSAGGPSPFVETPDGRVEFTGSGNGVNASTQGFGVDNQFVGNGESFTIEFHDPGQVGNQPALTNPDFVTSIALRNDNINGSLTIRVTVFNDVLGTSEVVFASLNVTGTLTVIDPIMTEFNRVLVEGIGGNGQGVRFTSLDISRTILPSDIDLQFNISATDRDGDLTSTSTLNVFVDADPPGAEIFDDGKSLLNDQSLDSVSRVAANENDARSLISSSNGMAASLVAAGLVAAIAGESPRAEATTLSGIAPDQPSRFIGTDNEVGQSLEAAAIDAGVDRFEPGQNLGSETGLAMPRYASFDLSNDVDDRGFGDDGGHSELLADLLAPTEMDLGAFARPDFAIGSHVDMASQALIANQEGGLLQHAVIEEVVADALAGGSTEGPNVDAMLNALAGPANDMPLLGDTLAQQFGEMSAFEPLNAMTGRDLIDPFTTAHMEIAAASGNQH